MKSILGIENSTHPSYGTHESYRTIGSSTQNRVLIDIDCV